MEKDFQRFFRNQGFQAGRGLMSDTLLPRHYKDHALAGNWSDYRDCHLKPDLVLIYQVTDDALILVRLGSHSELSL